MVRLLTCVRPASPGGFVRLEIEGRDLWSGIVLGSEKVRLRVAPSLLLPNTLDAEHVLARTCDTGGPTLGAANVLFVEDVDHYHVLSGEVHCGTNVLRKTFPFAWWEKQPAGIPSLP